MHQNSSQRYDHDDEAKRINALNLKWTLGLNFLLVDGVHNLSNDQRCEIFYAVAHTGVIYDYENNTQRLLQGHCNSITCTAYCKNEDLLVTADMGPDSMLVVWNAKTGIPRKTIIDPHPHGTQALDISPDGRYIVTLSREQEKVTQRQSITLWEWNSVSKIALITTQIDSRMNDYQYFIRFNPYDHQEFATTGLVRVIFFNWEDNEKGFEYYSPAIQQKHTLTQTVFIPKTSQAVTGTNDGHIIVWDISLIMEDYSQPEERRIIKTVNLMNSSKKSQSQAKKGNPAINILKIEDQYLVVGSEHGAIRFYDFQYRIIAWFEEPGIGPITNISFANKTLHYDDKDSQLDPNSTETLRCQEFIVVDVDAKITLLHDRLFQEFDKEKKKGKVILESIVSPIVSIAVRSFSNYMAISCSNGGLYQWNFQEKSNSLTEIQKFDQEDAATCIEYSPDGQFLSVASKAGLLHIYDVEKAEWQASEIKITEVENANPEIIMQVFSSDSQHIAIADSDFSVSLYTIEHKLFILKNPQEWCFVGKHRIHHSHIKSLAFGEVKGQKGEKNLLLCSVGQDMKLVIYDVIKVDHEKNINTDVKIDRLRIQSIVSIEQECSPTACIWYPINMFQQDVLLTLNEEYQIKLWQMKEIDFKQDEESQVKKILKVFCKQTCLGPTYGGAITKLLVLNPSDAQNDFEDKYLAYATDEKVVGIIKLPLEGNPNQTMGLIAHPSQITSIGSTNDGKLFFTSGGDDYCVNIWSVNTTALEQAFFTNQTEDPFPHLLEGGPGGQIHRDLQDFFYYSQIRSKDEHTTKARQLDGLVPLRAIPDMMRSMGYYPTEKEIQNMKDEIKYSQMLETNKQVEELDIGMFLKLFVNHRPVYGITQPQIIDALNLLSQKPGEDKRTGILTQQDFIQILTQEGEQLTQEQILGYFQTLLGQDTELPDHIDPDTLCDQILGFEDLDNEGRNMQDDEYQDEEGEQ